MCRWVNFVVSPKLLDVATCVLSTGFELVSSCCLDKFCFHLVGSHSHEDYADLKMNLLDVVFELSMSHVVDQHSFVNPFASIRYNSYIECLWEMAIVF